MYSCVVKILFLGFVLVILLRAVSCKKSKKVRANERILSELMQQVDNSSRNFLENHDCHVQPIASSKKYEKRGLLKFEYVLLRCKNVEHGIRKIAVCGKSCEKGCGRPLRKAFKNAGKQDKKAAKRAEKFLKKNFEPEPVWLRQLYVERPEQGGNLTFHWVSLPVDFTCEPKENMTF